MDTLLFTGSLLSRSSISGSGSRTRAVACGRRTFLSTQLASNDLQFTLENENVTGYGHGNSTQ